MTHRFANYLGLLAIGVGALMLAVPALAYTDTSPGSGMSANSSTVQPGGTLTLTATFTDLAAGTIITWSAAGSCTVSFSQTATTLDTNHQTSTQATVGTGCAGTNAVITATGPQGQTVSTTVAVAGGFPNTSTSPIPLGWMAMALGAMLILVGVAGFAWRRQNEAAAA